MSGFIKEVHEILKDQPELTQGAWGFMWGVLFAWHRRDRKREIIWKGIITAGIGVCGEQVLHWIGIPNIGSWFAIILISSIGADVILDRIGTKLGFESRAEREARLNGAAEDNIAKKVVDQIAEKEKDKGPLVVEKEEGPGV